MGYLVMKNEIKTKKATTKKQKLTMLLTISFIIISCGCGFLISFYGQGCSFIEQEFIGALITLFGFGLTSTVFIYQSINIKESEMAKKVIKSLSKTLLLTFILISISIIFDFLSTLFSGNIVICIDTIKYASLIYSCICQIDILLSFLIIIKH